MIAPSAVFSYTSQTGTSRTGHAGCLVADTMQSFDFQVVLNCPLETVFSIYVDTQRWRNRNEFGEIRWVQGKPWGVGSRLRVETQVPIRTSVDQVVQHFALNESVSYLSHAMGITCETRVTFTPVSVRQTAVNVVVQLAGTASRALDFALTPVIAHATKGFFEELRKDCEAASQQAPRD